MRRLIADARGLALIEFAIAAPVLLMMGLGGLEVAHYAIASLRVSQIAMTAADNAGRARDRITEADVNELMAGAAFVGRGIGFAGHGRIILSDLEYADATKRQWLRWQRCSGALAQASSYGVPLDGGGAPVTDLSNPARAPADYGAVPDRQMATAIGPAGNRIAAAPGTAVMFVEVSYAYQPIAFEWLLGPRTIRAASAFNVRQRTDQVLKSGGLAAGAFSDCTRFTG